MATSRDVKCKFVCLFLSSILPSLVPLSFCSFFCSTELQECPLFSQTRNYTYTELYLSVAKFKSRVSTTGQMNETDGINIRKRETGRVLLANNTVIQSIHPSIYPGSQPSTSNRISEIIHVLNWFLSISSLNYTNIIRPPPLPQPSSPS